MGKFSVALRQRSRPRLVVESFEDRRLLATGPLSSLLGSSWLTADNVIRSLDPSALTLVTQTSSTAASEEERAPTNFEENLDSTGETRTEERRTARKRQEERAERRQEWLEQHTQQEDQANTDENQEPALENETGDDLGANPVESVPVSDEIDAGGSESPGWESVPNLGEEGDRGPDGNTPDPEGAAPAPDLSGEGTITPPTATETPNFAPVVVQVLKHYTSENSPGGEDRGNGEAGHSTPAVETPLLERSVAQAPGDNSVGRLTTLPADVPVSRDSSDKADLPSRTPVASRSEDGGGSPVQPSLVDVRGADLVFQRREEHASENRGAEHPLPGQARAVAETMIPARGAESGEPRLGIANLATSAEAATAATLNRAESPARPGQAGVRSAQPTDQVAVEVVAAPEPAAEPPLAPARLGIMDMAMFVPHLSGLLEGVVPFDADAVQVAMQQFLEQVEDLGGDAASWLAQMNFAPWIVALAVGLTAYDVTRRRQQQAQRGLVLTDADGTPLTWFPGLAGLWTMREA